MNHRVHRVPRRARARADAARGSPPGRSRRTFAGDNTRPGSPRTGGSRASATSVAPTSASVGTYARPRAISRAASPFPRNHRQSRSSSAQNRTPPATATSGRPTAASPATVAVATEGASTRTRKRPTPSTTRKRPSRQASALGTSSAMISPSPRGSSRRAFGTGGGAGAGASAGGPLGSLALAGLLHGGPEPAEGLAQGLVRGALEELHPEGRRERHLDRQAGGGVAVVEAHVRDRLVRHRGGADYPNDRSEGGKRSCEARRRPEGRGASGDAKRRTNRSRHTCPRRADEHARRGVRRPRATPLWGPGDKIVPRLAEQRSRLSRLLVRQTRHCTSIPWVNGLQSRRASLSLARIASCFVRDDTRASRVLVSRRSLSAAIPLGGVEQRRLGLSAAYWGFRPPFDS